MLLTMKCACGKLLDVDHEQIGKPAQCPWCGNRFTAGDLVRSTTALQADEPAPRPIEREQPPPPPEKPVETPKIEIGHPWMIPPAVWMLIFGVLVCGSMGAAGAFFIGPCGGGASQADIARTQTSGALTHACQAYRLKSGEWPEKLDDLVVQGAAGGPYLESPDALVDPWGGRYFYDRKGTRNNGAKPDIWAVTPDGVEIGNWPKGD